MKNKMVKEFQNWGDVFKVEFAITVTKIPSVAYQNVFHFTTSGDYNVYGDRIPALWIANNLNKPEFFIASAVSGNRDLFKRFDIELGKQYQITIKQFKASGTWYEIIIDGESKYKIENTQPQSFSSVKLYASDPWYNPFSSTFGSICDIKIYQDGCETDGYYGKNCRGN